MKGVDFQETYARVSRLTSFRVMMAMAAVKDYHIMQLDVQKIVMARQSLSIQSVPQLGSQISV